MNRILSLTVLTLALTSCGGTAPLPSTPFIVGQVDVAGLQPDAISHTAVEGVPHIPVPVALNGQFQLPLPADPSPDGTFYGSPLCSGTVIQSNTQAQFMTLSTDRLRLWHHGTLQGFVTTRRLQGDNVYTYEYVYATLPTIVRGEQLCGNVTKTFALDYQQGWNLVEWTLTGNHLTLGSVANQRLTWRRP
ncbi:hypothetical protein [Deinococcus arboris]|nr:hypothetical protein [Deinococcus arboris]